MKKNKTEVSICGISNRKFTIPTEDFEEMLKQILKNQKDIMMRLSYKTQNGYYLPFAKRIDETEKLI